MTSSRHARPRADRGFSLIEVLVGATVSILAIGAVTAVFLSQQRSIAALDINRISAEAGRDSLLVLETAIRRAGFGIDPRYAFDFTWYGCAAATATNPCRDSITGPDNIVFVARNSAYRFSDSTTCTTADCFVGNGWQLTAKDATNSRITITLPNNYVLDKGRVLEMVCWNSSGTVTTMGTVPAKVTGTGAAQQIQLATTVAGNPYKANDFSATCFSDTNLAAKQAAVFLVDRYHFLVQTYSGVPWLVLDTGLDLDGDGTLPENGADVDDYIPIAAGVEDLQFAYLLNTFGVTPGNGPDLASGSSQGNWVVGDAATTDTAPFVGKLEQPDQTAANMPIYATAPTDALRKNTSVPNIRAVRTSVAVRSLLTDQTQGSTWTGDVEKRIENRSTASLFSGGRFRRFTFSSTISARDMEARSNFVW